MQLHSQPRSEFHQALSDDHARLERLFESLLGSVKMSDPERVRVAWERLDRELRAHLRIEEERILPLFEVEDTVEASQIRAEHHQIRNQLDQIGVDLDLHALDRGRAESFIHLLRDHAAREERTLYPWADSSMPKRGRISVIERLRNVDGHSGTFRGVP